MKLMEVFKLRIRCLAAASRGHKIPMHELRQIILESQAAQEYCTSGMFIQDTIAEIRDARPDPYIYDGRPQRQAGETKIIEKYNLPHGATIDLHCLAHALYMDITENLVQRDGTINYDAPEWIKSHVLRKDHRYVHPHDGLATVLAKILAAERTKNKSR